MPVGRRGAPSDGGRRGHVRELARRAAGHPDVIHQVVAEHAARIGEAVRELGRRRVEQERADSSACAATMHGARVHFLHLARVAIDVHHAGRLGRLRVHQDLVDHRVGDERRVARLERVGNGRERGVEVRVRLAALLARAAVVAGRAAVERLGDVRGAANRDGVAKLLLDPGPHLHLGAASSASRDGTCCPAAPARLRPVR